MFRHVLYDLKTHLKKLSSLQTNSNFCTSADYRPCHVQSEGKYTFFMQQMFQLFSMGFLRARKLLRSPLRDKKKKSI